ncbi:anti-sigma factor domain-containing protein [Hydrogenophaga sp. RWCD_12]|uniref:anti-sigma factor domain-containing protein n=1 Tax=Hydrogenophaga sp. RWCD_12 TaxID=3391190 RepID=UPI00398498BE
MNQTTSAGPAGDAPASTPEPAFRRVPSWWRALAIFLLLVILLGWAATASLFEQSKAQISHLQAKLAKLPQVRHIAVLLDDKAAPALLVTMDTTSGVLQLQRLNEVKEGQEDSMQLWAIQPGQPPQSLGVIGSKLKTLQLPAKGTALTGVTELAISVENKGGVPQSQGPRLPWLFKGALVQKTI